MNNIIIFGAGDIGKRVYLDVLAEGIDKNRQIFYFDNDRKKQGIYINQILVLTYEQFIKKVFSKEYGIILAADCWKELFLCCQKLNIDGQIIGIYNRFNFYSNPYINQVYSQEAEEIYLQDIFELKYGKKHKGFYVDVGAHHPYRFSNTQWAYKRGWRGINIEPNSEMIELFSKVRTRDININCGIGKTEKMMKYYKFEEPAYNTFNINELKEQHNLKEIVKVPVRTLESVFLEYAVEKIDFLNIDVEGTELSVLQSNNWEYFRPYIILVEQKDILVSELPKNKIYCYLCQLGYECEWKSRRTMIYRRK